MNDKEQKLIAKLEQLYPEKKVFALDALDGTLRGDLSNYAKENGFVSADAFLESVGFKKITGNDVKQLRNRVVYKPGDEPEVIKNKIGNLLVLLAEYYPERVIAGSMERDHKKVYSKVCGLCQWLGYADNASFLKAYGYDLVGSKNIGGRPVTLDADEILQELKKRYPNPVDAPVKTIAKDNPDLAGKLKTLQNKSLELFGKTYKELLYENGILAGSKARAYSVDADKVIQELKQRYPEGSPYSSLVALIRACPDISDELDYLNRNPLSKWNGSMKNYLISIGILKDNSEVSKPKTERLTVKECAEKLVEMLPKDYYAYTMKELKEKFPETRDLLYEVTYRCKRETGKTLEEYLLDCGILKKYCYCLVQIYGKDIPFYYISEIPGLKVSDIVSVPLGYDNETMQGKVMSIEFYTKEDAPYPPGRTKQILRSIPKDKADIETNGFVLSNDRQKLIKFTGVCQRIIRDEYSISVDYVGPWRDHPELQDFSVLNQVKEIAPGVFKEILPLQSIEFDDSAVLEKIGKEAFARTGIKKVILPDTVKEIGYKAFTYEEDGEEFYTEIQFKNNPYFKIIDDVLFAIREDGKLELINCYDEVFFYTVPENVVVIRNGAFRGCKDIQRVTLNQGLEVIENDAFRDCNLKKVTIPDSVISIGNLEDNIYETVSGDTKQIKVVWKAREAKEKAAVQEKLDQLSDGGMEVLQETGNKKYIRVKFEDGKAYNYFCNFDVEVGDFVYVDGKRAEMRGVVAELIDDIPHPNSMKAKSTLYVVKAMKAKGE